MAKRRQIKVKNPNEVHFMIPVAKELKRYIVDSVVKGVIPEVAYVTTGNSQKKGFINLYLATENKKTDALVSIGIQIERLRNMAILDVQSKKDTSKKSIQFKWPKKIKDEFKSRYEKELNLISTKGVQGDNVIFKFDTSHINSQAEMSKFVAKIYEARFSIMEQTYIKYDAIQLEQVIKNLEKFDIKAHQQELTRMTGQEMIDEGYADVFDGRIRNRVLSRLNRIITVFFKSKIRDYLYYGRIVHKDQSYAVKLRKAKQFETPQPIDYRKEVCLRYDWGEILYSGGGLDMVNRYQKELLDHYNSSVEAENKKADYANN
jgi:hypothetical protein